MEAKRAFQILAAASDKALKPMKPREINEVIDLESHFVLLWIKAEKPKSPPFFKIERARLHEVMCQQRQEDAINSWLAEARKTAFIERHSNP